MNIPETLSRGFLVAAVGTCFYTGLKTSECAVSSGSVVACRGVSGVDCPWCSCCPPDHRSSKHWHESISQPRESSTGPQQRNVLASQELVLLKGDHGKRPRPFHSYRPAEPVLRPTGGWGGNSEASQREVVTFPIGSWGRDAAGRGPDSSRSRRSVGLP